MTNQNTIERPAGTYSENYIKQKKAIMNWREKNPEYVTKYNREYQRKLRKDPIKYEELRMRINCRSYLYGRWKTSYKASSALGMTREEMARKYNMTVEEFKNMVISHELDHIVSNSWFNDIDNIHLKPYMYRHYNLQFIPKSTNRKKHKYVDETDLRVQLVIAQLELDYHNSKNMYDKKSLSKIDLYSKKAKALKTKIKNMYK
jgi:hypothetical protein